MLLEIEEKTQKITWLLMQKVINCINKCNKLFRKSRITKGNIK